MVFSDIMKSLRYIGYVALVIIATLIATALFQNPQTTAPQPVPAAQVPTTFRYTFNVDGSLAEIGSMENTHSPYWWLDSGGKLVIKDGVGETIQGDLPASENWYQEYARTNPDDTDGGVHPQNLFRLVSRSTWDDVRIEVSFKIVKDNLSKSANRNESNGLLLMSRYGEDGQTLYYSGIRVDGTAVIKKKYKGTYYTMAQEKVFPGTYDRDSRPNLLPHDGWIRLRGETVTNIDESVSVRLYMQDKEPGKWKLLVSARDNSQHEDTKPIVGANPIGIRTDFMDVQFRDIVMEKL